MRLPPTTRVVFVLGLVSLINSLTSGLIGVRVRVGVCHHDPAAACAVRRRILG